LSEDNWLAEVDWAGDNVFIGSDTSGHTVVYDSAEGTQRGIGPMRALLTSLGACTGMDIVAILKKRNQRLRSLRIMLSGERPESGHPRPWTSIHLKYLLSGDSLETEYVEEALKDSTERFCHVAATFRPTAKITYSYETTA
jgi:putative redox protein